MGTDQNPVQRTVVLILTMVRTLLDGAFNALVCVTVHKEASFEFGFASSMDRAQNFIPEIPSNVAFCRKLWYSDNDKLIMR